MVQTMIKGAADQLDDLLKTLEKVRGDYWRGRIRDKGKQEYLYLSQIHACTRHLFYIMTQGHTRQPFDEYVQALVESGNVIEDEVSAWLTKNHFEWIGKSEEVFIRNARGQLIGKGKIDGKMIWRGSDGKKAPMTFPGEIKKVNPNVWGRLNTIEDLFKFAYTEKYVRQLLAYLHGKGLDAGFFLLDDGSNHWKLIPVYWGNYLDYIERMLRSMEAAFDAKEAYEAGKKDVEPDRIKFDTKLCGSCDFLAMCMPDTVIEGGDRIEDDEWVAHLDRELEIKPLEKEYKDLHDSTKEFFKKKGTCNVSGVYQITVRKNESSRIDKSKMTGEEITKFSTTSPGARLYIKRLTADSPAKARSQSEKKKAKVKA